jgi:hypothetical protein
LPNLLLRLARRRLPISHRDELYEEWSAELQVALYDTDSKYLARLVLATRYALGLLIAARRIANDLGPARSPATSDPWLDHLLILQDRRRALLRTAAEFRRRHYEWCFDLEAACQEPGNLEDEGVQLAKAMAQLEDYMLETEELSPWGTLRGGLLFPDEPEDKHARAFLNNFLDPASPAFS